MVRISITHTYDAIQFRAMHSEFATYVSQASAPKGWKEAIVLWFSHFERMCSRFQATSFLSEFNEAMPYQPIVVPNVFYQVVYEAWELAKKTDFYFHPLVGDSMESIGYTVGFTPNYLCQSAPRHTLWVPADEEALIFHPSIKAIEKRTHKKLDLGGIGKGWSVEQAAMWLKKDLLIPAGMVDGAGDMYCWSRSDDPWVIGIEDPNDAETEMMQLLVMEGAVATSNTQYRRWQQGNLQQNHIINGKTGVPTNSEIVQATVIGSSTTEAEIVAKVLCMIPLADIPKWMENKFPHLKYILVRKDGRLYQSSNLQDHIVERRA